MHRERISNKDTETKIATAVDEILSWLADNPRHLESETFEEQLSSLRLLNAYWRVEYKFRRKFEEFIVSSLEFGDIRLEKNAVGQYKDSTVDLLWRTFQEGAKVNEKDDERSDD